MIVYTESPGKLQNKQTKNTTPKTHKWVQKFTGYKSLPLFDTGSWSTLTD